MPLIDTSGLETELARHRELIANLAARLDALDSAPQAASASAAPAPEPAPLPLPIPAGGWTAIPVGATILPVPDGLDTLRLDRSGTLSAPVVYVSQDVKVRAQVGRIVMRGNQSHVWLIGLQASELRVVADGIEGFLAEDCVFAGGRDNITIQAIDRTRPIRNVTLRRCLVLDASSSSEAHSQGAFIRWVDGLEINSCLFDHNGWKDGTSEGEPGEPTMFNHSVYLKECKHADVWNNIFSRASSFGLKVSSDEPGAMEDLVAEDNLFVGDASGITIGHSGGYAKYATSDVALRRNVFTDLGRTIGGQPQAFGVHISTVDGARVEQNYFIHKSYAAPHAAFELDAEHAHRDVTTRGNVVYQWQVAGGGSAWRTSGDQVSGLVEEGNRIEPSPPPAELRTVDEAARRLGHDDWADLLHSARERGRGQWRSEHSAATINQAMRGDV